MLFRSGLVARKLCLSLRTQHFETRGLEVKLYQPSSAPTELAEILGQLFGKLYRPHERYRATGIVLGDLTDQIPLQFGLFERPERVLEATRTFEAVDAIASKYGRHTVFLADGLRLLS